MKKWFFLIFLIPSICYGEDFKTLTFDEFYGGLFTNWPAHKLPPYFSPKMYNVFVDNGKIEKVKGFTVAGSSNVLQKISGNFPFYQETGNTRFLVTDSSYVLDTSDFKTYVLVSSGANTGVVMRCLQVRNKMWCGNGSDAWFTWDGTVKTVLDGTNGTPNVPKGMFPAYWQNRVWLLRSSADGSSLDFSAVSTTDNVKIAPDDSRAWPSTNNLSVGRGDGQLGNGLWVEDGQLAVGKERSIYKIYGTNPTNYFDRREETGIGVASHDSIVTLDGYSYFVGQDGIYEGRTRISDHIRPDFDQIQRAVIKTIQNTWNTQSDFSKGNFSFGSTVTFAGLLQPISENSILSTGGFVAPTGSSITLTNNSGTAITGTTSTIFALLQVATISPSYLGFTDTIMLWCRTSLVGGGFCNLNPSIDIKNQNTNQTITKDFTGIEQDVFGQQPFSFKNLDGNVSFGGQDVNQGSYTIRIRLRDSGTCKFDFYSATESNKTGISLYPSTTIQFLSDVSTITNTITAWSNFDAVVNTNGGSVSFFTRTSTSSVNITTQVWVSQSLGTRVNAPIINNYVQWASTITSASTSPATASNIDQVSISHIEGSGASNRPVAIDWNNRLWLLVSTESTGNFPRILVKSRITNKFKDAWMPIHGININSLAKDGSTTLYGGSVSTGVVYRLDFGTNFNGAAIESLYTTPEMVMDSPFLKKLIQNYLIEGEKESGNNLLIGTSVDQGDFTEKTLSTDGSGSYLEQIAGVANQPRNLTIRLRNNVLDKGMTIHHVYVNYFPTNVLPPPKQ